VIAFRGFIIASRAPDRFSMLTAVGITSWITIEAFMNIAVNIGLMPVTGVTLPFISYGGSSLISTLIGIGILLQISKYATGYTPSTGRRWNRGTYNAQYSRN
jgi:cell division protein FtsW